MFVSFISSILIFISSLCDFLLVELSLELEVEYSEAEAEAETEVEVEVEVEVTGIEVAEIMIVLLVFLIVLLIKLLNVCKNSSFDFTPINCKNLQNLTLLIISYLAQLLVVIESSLL